MKLSKLRSLCDKAIEKYGDMIICVFNKDYSYDFDNEKCMHDFKLRILSGATNLPGAPIDDDEESGESPASHYACIFYED